MKHLMFYVKLNNVIERSLFYCTSLPLSEYIAHILYALMLDSEAPLHNCAHVNLFGSFNKNIIIKYSSISQILKHKFQL